MLIEEKHGTSGGISKHHGRLKTHKLYQPNVSSKFQSLLIIYNGKPQRERGGYADKRYWFIVRHLWLGLPCNQWWAGRLPKEGLGNNIALGPGFPREAEQRALWLLLLFLFLCHVFPQPTSCIYVHVGMTPASLTPSLFQNKPSRSMMILRL